MKKLLYAVILLYTCITYSQAPEKFTYQAVIRDAGGTIVSDQTIGIKISILQGTANGTAVYAETHTENTNTNGLLTIEIGAGTVVSGIFSEIEWGADDYYIKTETDINGGSNYTISGTSQLLSVPYALQAKNASNVPSYKVGDFAHGGVVFWVDETGQHGLVCSKENLVESIRWFAGNFGVTNAKSDGIYAGKSNTTIALVSHAIVGDDNDDYAAKICNEYEVVENTILYGDWYLPSSYELKLISLNLALLNTTSVTNGGEAFLNGSYWSSTEDNNQRALIVNVTNAQENSVLKSSQNPVRAIRSF